MPDSKRFLHPEAIARISPLELRARYIVEGFLSGSHRSPYFGQSVEFLQHREYAPGDDLRHVDWKVWGKQDKLIPVAHGESYAKNLPNCRLETIDNCGHMLPFEKPDEFVQKVVAFLK